MVASKSAYDLYLTISGVKYGFLLAEQDGVRQLNDGSAPIIAPQFRTGSYDYTHIPPEIEVAEAFENWSGGAGYEQVTGATAKTVYNYSQGLDLSHGDRIYLSPVRQVTSTILDTPTGFLETSLGFFMWAGPYIYEWDLASTTWVQRDDASSDAVDYKWMVEIDGKLMASRGASIDYKTSTDGVTWSAFTAENENADYMVNRGNASDIAALWKMQSNLVKVNVDPTASGWTGADEVGHTSETVNGMITVNNDIFIFKREGIYVYDGTSTQDIWKTNYLRDTNGKNPILWSDGNIYVPYGDRLMQIDPVNITRQPVFPTDTMDSLEIKGTITATAYDDEHIYLAVKNRSGNTYIMKGQPSRGWHTYDYMEANDCDALYVVGPGVGHTTNPTLHLGFGTGARFYILPRVGLHPGDDPSYRFRPAEFNVVGPWVDFGAKAVNKFLNRGAVLCDNASADRTVVLKYEIDRSGSESTLVSATSDGLTQTDEGSDVEYSQIRYDLYLRTKDEFVSPVVDSCVLFSTMNPTRKHMWNPIIILDDSLETRMSDGANQPSSEKMKEILYAALEKRVTLTDEYNNTYIVNIKDMQSTGVVSKQEGGAEHYAHGYQLKIVEIQSLSSNETVGVYGSSEYGEGHVYDA